MLRAQKWAEIKIPYPSLNFFRPCGQDRYELDQQHLACAWAYGPNVIEVNQSLGVSDGTLCRVVAVEDLEDALYTVTQVSSSPPRYSLVKAQLTAFDKPLNMPAITTETGLVGALRWPGAWGIAGRVGVASVLQLSSTVKVTTYASVCLHNGDHVDFSDVPGLTSDMTVLQVVSPTEFFVTGTAGTYSGGGYVASHGAPGYGWHDSDSKGDFHLAEWRFNYRDFAERDRVLDQWHACNDCADAAPADTTEIRPLQAGRGMPREVSWFECHKERLFGETVSPMCIPFGPCDPQVIAITPNGETWSRGYVKNFYHAPLDTGFGARWQMCVVQRMQDPLWQEPKPPCKDQGDGTADWSACGWAVDDGSCNCTWMDIDGTLQGGCTDNSSTCVESNGVAAEGSVAYYPLPKFVEALAALPSGAPNPLGLTFGYATIADLNSATAPTLPPFPPPGGTGYLDDDEYATPIAHQTPWGDYINQMHCVCLGGQFSAQYQANGISIRCPPITTPDPDP
jgi:hypothetical protein